MHVTASTTCLRPIRIPSPTTDATSILRRWMSEASGARARRLLLAIEPTSGKLARRSREGLRAAIKILGTDPVQLAHVGQILRGMGGVPHLGNARLGYLDDEALWEDAQNALGIAQAAAERKRAAPGAVELLGKCLSVVDVLLSVPEGERAAVVGREMA